MGVRYNISKLALKLGPNLQAASNMNPEWSILFVHYKEAPAF